MRKMALTVALVALLAVPVLAQRGGFGFGGGQGGDLLLANKSVQDELKLSDAQKKDLEEIAKKATEMRTKAFEAFKDGDREEGMKLFQKVMTDQGAALKKFKTTLTKDQAKRFLEIEVQVATRGTDANIFAREEVQKGLKFTAKQKSSTKEAISGLESDLKEILDDAKESMDFRGAMTKTAAARKKTFESITKTFSDDQKATWKEMGGKKFEMKMDNPFGGKGGGGFKRKQKKDDE